MCALLVACCLWPHGCCGRRVCFFGPGCLVCPWAAARPLAVRAASCCLLPRQISGRRAACPPARRPRRELRSVRRLEARPGPAGLAAASNRSGCLCVVRTGLAAAHGHRSRVLRTPNVVWLVVLGFWGAPMCVVTNVVNPTAFWLKMVVFWLRLTTFVTQALAGRFKLRWFDDVCNVGRPSVAHSGLATTYGRRSLVLSTRWPGGLKPLSPLRAGEVGQLKPPSPLRVRKGCF